MNTLTLVGPVQAVEPVAPKFDFDSAPFEAQLNEWAVQHKSQIETIRMALQGSQTGLENLALAMTRAIANEDNQFISSNVASWNSASQREQKQQAKNLKIENPTILKMAYDSDSEEVIVTIADKARNTKKNPWKQACARFEQTKSAVDLQAIIKLGYDMMDADQLTEFRFLDNK